MFLAVWWRSDHSIREELSDRIRGILDPSKSLCAEGKNARISVWPPGRLQRNGRGAIARAAGSSAGSPPQAHPAVELQGETLTAIAGPLLFYPLYYHRASSDNYVLICSRLEPLARLLPHEPLNAARIVYDMQSSKGAANPDPGATVFAGIRHLRPCEALIASDAGVRLERRLPRLGSKYTTEKPKDLAIELRGQIEAVVARAVDPGRRVAVFVSGGLDSSGVLAFAAARSSGTGRYLIPISAQFATPGDDRPHFEELMAVLGLTPVRISARDGAKWFGQSLCVDAQPTGSPACLGLALCEAAVAQRADVSLCASMGDNLLGGTLPFAQLALRGHPLAALAGALRVRVPWNTTACSRLRSFLVSPLIPPTMFRRRRRERARSPWLTARSLALLDRAYATGERSDAHLPDTPDEWMQALCDDPNQCSVADRMGQMLSLTGCAVDDVFMDLEFVRFVLRIDPLQLSYGNEHRGLYRAAMKGVLPEGVRTRQTKAFIEPALAAAAVAADAVEMLRDLGSLEKLASHGIVDPSPLRPVLDRWMTGLRRGERTDKDPGDEYSEQVWQLLSIEAFLREHGRGRALA
jgi:asparagine synthetase B (glutamine-hydrolysing)